MFETCLLNIGSLFFGIIALVLPIIHLVQSNTATAGRLTVFTAASLSACAVSLCLQIFELSHRVRLQDWSALMDTSRAVTSTAVSLLAGTVIFNAIVLVKHSAKRQNGD